MRTTLTLLLLGALPTPALAQHGTELPPAETLFERHLEARGGEAAFARVESLVRTGKLDVDIGGHAFIADVTDTFLSPNRLHQVIDGDHFTQVSATDGERAWQWRPGHSHGDDASVSSPGTVELLEGRELEIFLEKAWLAKADWRRFVREAETVGLVDVRERPAYEVHVTSPSGKESMQYFDRETGLLVKRARNDMRHDEEMYTETYYEDYRESGGLLWPMKVHVDVSSPLFGEGTQVWTYDRFDFEAEIRSSLFELPAALHADEGSH